MYMYVRSKEDVILFSCYREMTFGIIPCKIYVVIYNAVFVFNNDTILVSVFWDMVYFVTTTH